MFTNSTAHVQKRKQVFRVCYLVQTRAMAQMARVNFVCVTVITCLHSNCNMHDTCAAMTVLYIAVNSTGHYIDHYIL